MHANAVMEEGKKISFGFTKLSKQPKVKPVKANDDNIQYIEFLDSKAIKIKGVEEKVVETEIIIPLNNSINPKDNKLVASVKKANARNELSQQGSSTLGNNLDDIAARELIEEASNTQEKHTEDQITLSLPSQKESENDVESTLDDYEAVPISKFGTAMLRGMGWDPTTGIGKSEKVVTMKEPKVRPRGMGLGVMVERSASASKTTVVNSKPEEELKIVKGAYIQVTSGHHRDLYGQIEGFNEETGRLIIKLALGATSLSLNEYMVKPVTKDDFSKNSRVLNASKFQEYKLNENQGNSSVLHDTFSKSDKSRKHVKETERSSPRSYSRSQSKSASPPRRKHKKKDRSRRRSRSRSRSHSSSPFKSKSDFGEKYRRKKSRSRSYSPSRKYRQT